jgi:hypothetical protein
MTPFTIMQLYASIHHTRMDVKNIFIEWLQIPKQTIFIITPTALERPSGNISSPIAII